MSSETDHFFELLVSRFSSREATLNEAGSSLGKPDYGTALRESFEHTRLSVTQGAAIGTQLVEASRVLKTEAEPLLGLLFLELGRACQRERTLTLETFKEGLRNAVTGIVRVGGARFGSGTLLDTLLPVSETVHATQDLNAALAGAARAANETATRLSENRAYPSSLAVVIIMETLVETFGL